MVSHVFIADRVKRNGSLARSMMRTCSELMLILLCTGCASLPLQQEVPVRNLIINNMEGTDIEISRLGGDRTSLGAASQIRLKLQAGRYVLHAKGLAYGVPLLAEVISPASALTINLQTLPDVPPGFVFIPGGPTLIGDILGVGAVDERPVRIVEISAFFAAEAETTNAQYVAFLNARRICDVAWIDLGGPKCLIWQEKDGHFATDAPNIPAVTVTYSGATAFCAWKTESTGNKHRLPTETEWERVARGPASTTYAYGDVYDPKAANQESGVLMRTRSFPATGWGVFDATGNAFEWTSSEYAPGLQVLKGGSYVLDGPYLRNSFRMWYRPAVQADDIGFRVIQEIRK